MGSGWAIGISVIVAFGVLLAVDIAFDYWFRQWRISERRKFDSLDREVRSIERKKDADV